jgi:hypothetical protein
VTDVLDDTIRSYLVELVDATPPPPEYHELAGDAWLRSTDVAAKGRRRSRMRSGLVAAAAVCAVALAIGLVVTVTADDGSRSPSPATASAAPAHGYYRATTTFLVDLSQVAGQNPAVFQKLAQLELFVTKGDVPDAVAATLGGDESGARLARSITMKTDTRKSSVAITAVARTRARAELLADTFGAELVQVLDQKNQAEFTHLRDQLQARLDDLTNQQNALYPRIAANPPDVENLKNQLSALGNQYRISYDMYAQLTAAGPPTSRFTLVERARAKRIDKAEYDRRRHDAAS